jgi:hypothetical protein
MSAYQAGQMSQYAAHEKAIRAAVKVQDWPLVAMLATELDMLSIAMTRA